MHNTYAISFKHFYWYGLHNKDVEDYVMHCQKFEVNQAKHLKACGLLHLLEIPNKKLESFSMDFTFGKVQLLNMVMMPFG